MSPCRDMGINILRKIGCTTNKAAEILPTHSKAPKTSADTFCEGIVSIARTK